MTATDTYPVDAARSERPPHTRQKGVLFCEVCGYENPVGGDWDRSEDGESQTLYCPDCGTQIDDR